MNPWWYKHFKTKVQSRGQIINTIFSFIGNQGGTTFFLTPNQIGTGFHGQVPCDPRTRSRQKFLDRTWTFLVSGSVEPWSHERANLFIKSFQFNIHKSLNKYFGKKSSFWPFCCLKDSLCVKSGFL